jgi:hypothetical protein
VEAGTSAEEALKEIMNTPYYGDNLDVLRRHITLAMVCSLWLLASALGQSKTPPQQTPFDTTKRLREERVFQKKPARGYVPDATTAVRIAEAVLTPIYGAKQVGYEKPFNATLDGDVWTIQGTLDCKTTAKSIWVGGTAVVQLSKTTGAVLLLVHEE